MVGIGKLVSAGSHYRLALTYIPKLAVWIIGMAPSARAHESRAGIRRISLTPDTVVHTCGGGAPNTNPTLLVE